jgi:hypothetical protein
MSGLSGDRNDLRLMDRANNDFDLNLFRIYMNLKYQKRSQVSDSRGIEGRRAFSEGRGTGGGWGGGWGGGGEDKPQKKLMDMKQSVYPNPWYSFQNWTQTTFIIRPYFDKEFSPQEFLKGAKQALVFVSHQISEGNMERLRGVVEEKALEEISRNILQYNANERHNMRVNEQDIGSTFLYRTGIIINEDETRFVEITVVYHCRRGGFYSSPTKMEFKDITEGLSICNYRFIREYTKGVSDEWTVNGLNHYDLVLS